MVPGQDIRCRNGDVKSWRHSRVLDEGNGAVGSEGAASQCDNNAGSGVILQTIDAEGVVEVGAIETNLQLV